MTVCISIDKMKIKITDFNPFQVVILILAGFFILWLGIEAGKSMVRKQEVQTPDNILEMQMDKSCFDQFQNNMNKTLYLKLEFKDK
jgi:hypothetical protein